MKPPPEVVEMARRILELAEKATPAPWKHIGWRGGGVVGNYAGNKPLHHMPHIAFSLDASGEDAAWVAETRTLSPQLARFILEMADDAD